VQVVALYPTWVGSAKLDSDERPAVVQPPRRKYERRAFTYCWRTGSTACPCKPLRGGSARIVDRGGVRQAASGFLVSTPARCWCRWLPLSSVFSLLACSDHRFVARSSPTCHAVRNAPIVPLAPPLHPLHVMEFHLRHSPSRCSTTCNWPGSGNGRRNPILHMFAPFWFSRRHGATESDLQLAVDDARDAIRHQTFGPRTRWRWQLDAHPTILAFVAWRPKSLRRPSPAVLAWTQILVQTDRTIDDQRSNRVLMHLRDSVAP
jgi:hypothetical protein